MEERSGSLRAFSEASTSGKHTHRMLKLVLNHVVPFLFQLRNIMESSVKRTPPRRIRHRLETECETEAEKDAISMRLQRIRELLSPDASHPIDNCTLLHAMFDIVEREVAGLPRATPHTNTSCFMMKNSGKCC